MIVYGTDRQPFPARPVDAREVRWLCDADRSNVMDRSLAWIVPSPSEAVAS